MLSKDFYELENTPYIKIDNKLQPLKIDKFSMCKNENTSFEGRFFGESINCKDLIKKVVFNNPATIVYWKDGTKTVVKCQDGDKYDKEKGLAMAIVKKLFGNKGNYNKIFKKYIGEDRR